MMVLNGGEVKRVQMSSMFIARDWSHSSRGHTAFANVVDYFDVP